MPKEMNAQNWRDRAEAYGEASEHLLLNWTDDHGEYEQGKFVAAELMIHSTNCLRIASGWRCGDSNSIMPRKPRSKPKTTTTDSFKEAVKFVSLVCNDKGPVNETHIYIGGGWAAASNGVLTIACPIQGNTLYVCPQSKLLNEALSKCGQEYRIEPPFTVISKKFKAIIPCIDPVLMAITAPDNPIVDINDTLKVALETVSVLVNDNAQRIYGASILLNGQSVVSTENGTMLFEYWHGLNDMPVGIAIPKDVVKVLSGISKKLTQMGCSERSVTFYFEDQSWIKTQLFAEKWPDVTEVLNKSSNENQMPIPKDFWEGVEAVVPFSPDGVVWARNGSLYSHAQEGAGASFECPGIPGGLSFSARQLLLLKPLADTIDFFTPSGVRTMLTFQGKSVRGAIAGRSQ